MVKNEPVRPVHKSVSSVESVHRHGTGMRDRTILEAVNAYWKERS